MPIELLKYRKDQGMVSVKIIIDDVPVWNYVYNEDREHDNSKDQNLPKEHSLGKPHELKKPIHMWRILLTNIANFEITAHVVLTWHQIVDGVETEIHKWEKSNVKIKEESGEEIGDQIILRPI